MGELLPALFFLGELFASERGKPVIARAAVVVRDAPSGGDPAILLHAVQSGVERALFDAQHLFGHFVDTEGNAPTVHRPELKRFQDQESERALEDVAFVLAHGSSIDSYREGNSRDEMLST